VATLGMKKGFIFIAKMTFKMGIEVGFQPIWIKGFSSYNDWKRREHDGLAPSLLDHERNKINSI
jgi:hypothetical protein